MICVFLGGTVAYANAAIAHIPATTTSKTGKLGPITVKVFIDHHSFFIGCNRGTG
jgi:hypothetical protein